MKAEFPWIGKARIRADAGDCPVSPLDLFDDIITAFFRYGALVTAHGRAKVHRLSRCGAG